MDLKAKSSSIWVPTIFGVGPYLESISNLIPLSLDCKSQLTYGQQLCVVLAEGANKAYGMTVVDVFNLDTSKLAYGYHLNSAEMDIDAINEIKSIDPELAEEILSWTVLMQHGWQIYFDPRVGG